MRDWLGAFARGMLAEMQVPSSCGVFMLPEGVRDLPGPFVRRMVGSGG